MDRTSILNAKIAENPIDPLAFGGPIGECPVLGFGIGAGHFVLLAAFPINKPAEDERAIAGRGATIHYLSPKINVSVHLHYPVHAAWEEQTFPGTTFQVRKYMIDCLTMNLAQCMHELTEEINCEADIWPSVGQIEQFAHQLLILVVVHWRRVPPFTQFDVGILESMGVLTGAHSVIPASVNKSTIYFCCETKTDIP